MGLPPNNKYDIDEKFLKYIGTMLKNRYERKQIFQVKIGNKEKLATKNLVKGTKMHNEKIIVGKTLHEKSKN